MFSLRSINNIPTRDTGSVVNGAMGQHKIPVECHGNEDKLRQKFLARTPRLTNSPSMKRVEAQSNKKPTKSDCFPTSGGGPNKRKTLRAVQFSAEPVVHTYDANPSMEQDIWWLAEELDALRKVCIAEESGTIKEYLIAYKRSFREIKSIDKVSSQNMADLVAGIFRGHRGLEIFTALHQVERKHETDSVIASVVALHQSQKHGNGGESAGKLLRAHSTALTARSRHWAQALGKADMYAASDSIASTRPPH